MDSGAAVLLRTARQRANLTQVELAVRAGVTQSVISTYENNRREPSFAVLHRLLVAAGFEPEVVLHPRPERKPLRNLVGERRDEVIAAFEGLGGRNVRLFGSVARGDDTAESDVDLMVDLDAGAGLFALMEMQDTAEQILGVRVDVVCADGLSGGAARNALADAIAL
ncbi:XRE family transcriptional regulator [Curtobacterium sp. Leaf261]|uniref:XRE family transcriptional regulator n=1 Tax=Curtobacterium sp. Leaf261 TaxID=1736311 RepID=UPI001910B5EA|nr:XRE family transcriptional regulator [Curtobacterium sp. Leaf261]